MDLSFNKINRISEDAFKVNNNLKFLDLSKNKLKDIDSVTMPLRLVHLNLVGNQLTKITKDIPNNLRNLIFLQIANNPFNAMDLENFLNKIRFSDSKVEIDVMPLRPPIPLSISTMETINIRTTSEFNVITTTTQPTTTHPTTAIIETTSLSAPFSTTQSEESQNGTNSQFSILCFKFKILKYVQNLDNFLIDFSEQYKFI